MQAECFGVKFLDPKLRISFDIEKTGGCRGIVTLGRVVIGVVYHMYNTLACVISSHHARCVACVSRVRPKIFPFFLF
jgi:hypothetical protein